jgi:uncharacterized protein YecE (DUF72 family)
MDSTPRHTRRPRATAPRPRSRDPGVRVRAGTSGFSYKEWKGSFYPEELPASEMLRWYAERLGACEINNTFYRMPKRDLLAGWAGQTDEDFRFALKASRRITHQSRLKDVAEPLDFLMRNASVLGPRLGPFLFQLPPYLRKDLERLERFLALIPDGRRAALEFRHPSWFEDDVLEALRAHDAALCVTEAEESVAPRAATAGWGYLRLRREEYDEAAIDEWAAWTRAQEWSEAYVFFKHEEAGAGPRLAERFMAAAIRAP